jgi:tetratricopeptide (TPR) repeat protein
MLRMEKLFPCLFLLFCPLFLDAEVSPSPYEGEYMQAFREKEYAFKLVPEFHEVLIKKGFAPSLNFNYIRWKYENEIRRRPENPFLAFCLGELYRYKNRYEEAEGFYNDAITKAEDHPFRQILLLELFSQRRLYQWQTKQEDEFLVMKKDLGALSLPLVSKYFFVRAKDAAEMGLDPEVEKSIRLAKELDPYNLGIRFYYVRFLLHSRRFDFFDEFLSSIRLLFVDFNTRLKFLIFSYNYLYVLFLLISCGLLLGFFIRYFPYAAARITALLPRRMAPNKKQFIAVVILALPLVWTLPSFLAFAYILLVPMAFLERKERWLLQIFLFLLGILSFFGGFQSRSFTSIDPSQRINLIDQIQKSRYEKRWVQKCDSLLALSNRDFAAYYLKGLQLKRGGLFDEAEMSYRNAISIEPRVHETYNNLANTMFWKEEIDSALKYYETALAFEPESPEAHYNIAQAYVRKLQFEKSSQHMKQSSDLDFELISQHTKNSVERNNRFLIDCIIPDEFLWMEFSGVPEEEDIFPWKYFGMHYRTVCILLIMFVFLYIIIARIARGTKEECPICTSPITKGNSSAHEKETICWRCFERLRTIHSLDIQDRLRDKIRNDTRLRLRYTAVLCGLFVPGLGHLQAGRTKTGTLFLVAFSILCTLLLVSRVSGVAFYPQFPKTAHYGLFAIILCIVVLYLFSLLSLFAAGYETRK